MTPAYVLSGESDCKKIFVFRDEYATAFHWFGLEWSLHPPIVVSVLPSLQTSYRAPLPQIVLLVLIARGRYFLFQSGLHSILIPASGPSTWLCGVRPACEPARTPETDVAPKEFTHENREDQLVPPSPRRPAFLPDRPLFRAEPECSGRNRSDRCRAAGQRRADRAGWRSYGAEYARNLGGTPRKLVEIFATHPELARTYALDAKTRASLLKADPSNAALVEQDVPLTGQLVVSTADDFVHHTSTKHYTLHTFTGDRGVSFTSSASGMERLEGRKVTLTGLSLPEVVAAETVRAASPSEVKAATASDAAVAAVVPAIAPAATALPFTGSGVPSGSATALGTTLGNQTTAVLIVKFAGSTTAFPTGYDQQSFWNQTFNGPATPNIAAFMKEGSYGQTTVSADVYGPITIPGNFTCNTVDTMATAVVAATASSIDYTKYNHIAFMFTAPTCYFGGLANDGEQLPTALIPHQYSYTWIWTPPYFTITSAFDVNFQWLATNHEFGHNLNLNHGNSIDFGPRSLGPLDYVSVNPGTVTPGGDAPAGTYAAPVASSPLNETQTSFATPAVAPAAPPSGSTNITAVNTEYGELFANMGNGQATFSAQHATQELNWIPSSGTTDITSSGSFTLNPVETNTGIRSLHVLRDPASSSWIWVEFHQPLGIYTPLAFTVDPYNVSNDVLSGAQLHYQDGFKTGDQHTNLMDMSPAATPNDFFHSNLTPGNSWSDPFSLLTITTGAQTNTSLGMSVSYDTPCAAVSLDTATIPTAGGTGTVTLTAPASCNWSVSSNASWISFPGTTTGTGNGSVSYVSAANTTAAQRNSYITAQRQSLPIVQPGTGVSILPRTPVSTTVGAAVPLTFNIVDNLGFADLSELDITISGGTQPDCVISTASSSSGGVASKTDVFFTLTANGVVSAYGDTGSAGIISNPYCSVDAGASSYSANGKTATLTLAVSFPASYIGVHSIYGVGYGSTSGISVPLSYVNVTASGGQTPSVVLNPVSASAPSTGSSDLTVPFTITGTKTNFTASSAVTVGGSGVTAKKVVVVNPTTITGNFVVKPTASAGSQPVTITTGSEVDAASFLVKPADTTPSIVLSPASGTLGTTVPVAIVGTGTSFTASSVVTISGTRVKARNVTYVSATELNVDLVLDSDADAGARTVTVTSGSEVDTATFNVNPAPIPHVVAVPATGNQGDTVAVVFTGTDTNFSDATTLKIAGTDIKVKDITSLNATTLATHLVISSSAAAGTRVMTIATGTQIVKVNFTVTAYTPTTTTIAAAEASIKETAGTTLTITVTPTTGTGTPSGFVSFLETKAGGLETILGTVALSNGKATLPISNLTVGVHSFYAQYLGDNASFCAIQLDSRCQGHGYR
jgi:hypothetical protein